MSNSIDDRLARLIDIKKELDLRKALFAEYDQIVVSLAQDGFLEALVGDLRLELKDNFAESNTGWTSAAVKRYEMIIEPKDKKRKAK